MPHGFQRRSRLRSLNHAEVSPRNFDASSRPALISGELAPARERAGAGSDRGGVDNGDNDGGGRIGAIGA